MKNIISFITTLLIIAAQSVALSALFCLAQWLLSLFGVCNVPTWHKFVWGGVGLFCLFFIYSCYTTFITMYRFYKDPVFKEMNLRMGITWKDYKRFRKTKQQE